ncbi:hypothetical protein BAUCODRAFT_470284 [Baudoinia panamericana UAMH 10762]|uniref:AB hydrolase-1 domain-containing protein n=1 Tax=Baudoinia panamericana (strain UAMH 10762) TaxID=717646 RepID=M2MI31_BAUPA|nr:uncharacterized protein BAUCODRAFT_470284 [Baudoinia panamericana UAMH 10762]EMC96311.1 hypothetical protein BAUCODRAFT_470284 [Baudoinia panamericana UAMH 10762]
MKFSTAVAVAAIASLAEARQCANFTVPVQLSARNGVFNQTTPVTNIDVTNFFLNLTQQGGNYSAATLTGYRTVSGTYNIEATYCRPDNGSANTVQVLTHGIGFDRTYWDVSYNNFNYSYVAEAVDTYGYSTFSWDRLGVGMSQHGEPVNEIQALLEVDALRALTQMLRNGSIECTGGRRFNKIVHVGHSFGSDHTYALTAMYPNISDGIALTGFSQTGTFVPYFALGGNFVQANTMPALSGYVDGYFASGDPTGAQTNFFAPGMFDPNLLTLASTSLGQPVTVGELLTIGAETASVNHIAKPVLIITGGRDVPFCGGNCLVAPPGFSSIPQQALTTLPNAVNGTAVIVPNAGHGLNLEYSHPFTYGTINNYFVQNGLGPH